VVCQVSKVKATELLGTMLGGYNVEPLDRPAGRRRTPAPAAAEGLKKTLLVFDFFHDVEEKAKAGNANAKAVMQSWADAEWFTSRPAVPPKKVTVFKVTGETNTDDLSPAQDAWSRPDIPLHANAMLKNPRDGITPDKNTKSARSSNSKR
jgi:aconitate hydratase 2/2-methylisocitrate dehydratase